MEKSNKAATIYGYSVCLVAVITFIICVASVVNALIDKQDPLYADRWGNRTPSLASYENYKADILKTSDKENVISLDEPTLRSMYEAAVNDVIRRVNHDAYRSLFASGLLIFISIILFVIHWIWMRRISS